VARERHEEDLKLAAPVALRDPPERGRRMIQHPWNEFRHKNVLLLQGPVGPFFNRLAAVLSAVGAKTYKVNFNGGDCLFYRDAAVRWRGSMDAWPDYLESLLDRLSIDVIILFGDCRPVHRVARSIAQRRGLKIGAFEEGYIRPNFVTFEKFGVNGYSSIPRTAEFYERLPEPQAATERDVGNTFWYAALWAILYYCAAAAMRGHFRTYRHHRKLELSEALPWLRGGWRKMSRAFKERGVLAFLAARAHQKFFLVPLQISGDSQVLQHSGFASVADFVRCVVESFATHAPKHTMLVIKHHPLDRGYHDYGVLLAELAERHGLKDRLLYIHDQHLPTLFDHMLGAVVINSTVGFSALSHSTPVKTCGLAIYDIPGLTFQGSLDSFWREAQEFRPDPQLFARFRAYVIDQTQINCSFYKGSVGDGICASMEAPTPAVPAPLPLTPPLAAKHAYE
jgi:capsular polysaccharide export protein